MKRGFETKKAALEWERDFLSITFYDITKAPFKLYGNSNEAKNQFARMPENMALQVSAGVYDRALKCAGVRVHFKTNSKRLGVKVRIKNYTHAVTQSELSAKGFDVYVNGQYRISVRPFEDTDDYYEQLVNIGEEEKKDITLYFPYTSEIQEFSLGLDKDAFVQVGDGYSSNKPLVFYGSSITHGLCASRPGNVFSAMISRKLDLDFINLGFGGVCRGEASMADYLASLEKSVLVCEYDHNEPNAESLRANHLPFYKRLRQGDRKTPIIFVSSPNKIYGGGDMAERMRIVEETCKYALENGDSNTFFINGQELYPEGIEFDCSADAVHPNDLGSYMIAERISEKINEILKIN